MIPEAVVAMLACARIGAPHSVVFGGFSAEALRSRIDDAEAKLVITADGGYRRGTAAALKPAVDEAVAHTPVGAERARRPAHRAGRRLERQPRRLVARRRRHGLRRAHGRADGRRAPAVHPLHLGHHREAEGHPAHHRRLPDPGGVHPPHGLRPQAGDRRLLVHRRRRLGHRAQLHRLRAAGQRRHPGDVRGHPGHPAPGPVLGDHREVRGHHALHRADADPHVHEVGRGDPGQVRPVLAAAARQRRRADQPRGLDLVPPGHRRRPSPRSSTPGGRPRPARS